MSTSTPTTSITTSISTESNPVASTIPTPLIKRKPTARLLKVKRRGAKIEEDEGEEEDGGKVSVNELSDSESELSAAEDDEDEEEGSDAETDAEKVEKVKSEAVVVKEGEGTREGVSTTIIPAIIPPTTLHPSWSDLPAVGEEGSTDLPVLEFSNLTTLKLNETAKPVVIKKDNTSLTPEEFAAKKLANAAQREARSAAAKEKDPVAWDIAEKARKEKELERKKEKREKSKEKKKLERLLNATSAAQRRSEVVSVVPVRSTSLPPSTSTSKVPTPRAPREPREPRQPKLPRTSVPSRPSRASVNADSLNPTSTTTDSLPPTSNAPTTSARNSRPPNQGRFVPPAPLFVQAAQAREEYATKSQDPTFTPKIGRFHTHDDRLQIGSERLMTPYWRGRGKDGEMRGGRGGRVRGGYTNGRGGADDDRSVRKVEKSSELEGEDDDDDNWGRGEAKRTTKNSSTPTTFPAVSDWTHDGFEEFKVDNRPPRVQRPNEQTRGGVSVSRGGAVRGGRGGIRGGIQISNGLVRGVAPIQQQPLGEINPQYADLPFHPRYRYPYVGTAPVPEDTTVSRHVEGDSHLFVEEGVTAVTGVVKLPSATAAVDVVESVMPVVEEVGIRVNLGGAPKVVVPVEEKVEAVIEVVAVSSTEVEQPHAREVSPRGSTSVLYATDPKEIERSLPPVASASTYQPNPQQIQYYQQQQLLQQQQQQQQMQQQMQQQQQYQQQSYTRQLPPHLQQQPQQQNLPFAPRPQHFIPRNGSPAFYPHPQYYSPEHSFPNMPTPGTTPPPLFSNVSRNSKIDIRDPSQGRSSLSATGEAFAPRGAALLPLQQQLPYLVQDSPHSSRDSIGQAHSPNPYAYGGYGQERSEGYPENGQVVYFQQQQQQPQQNYYDSYGGGNPYHSQQQVDPAILQMSNGYYDSRSSVNGGRGGMQQQQQQMQQQQQQNYYRQDGSPPFDSY